MVVAVVEEVQEPLPFPIPQFLPLQERHFPLRSEREELVDSSRVLIGAPEQMEHQVPFLFRETRTQLRGEEAAAAVWMVTTGNRGARVAAEPLVEPWEPGAPPAAPALQALRCTQMEGRLALLTVEAVEGRAVQDHQITAVLVELFGASLLPPAAAAGETGLEALL